MLTKSFKKGFGDDFVSPFSFFLPHSIEEPEPATIDSAWKDVGNAWGDVAIHIRESVLEEIERIEKEQTQRLCKEK